MKMCLAWGIVILSCIPSFALDWDDLFEPPEYTDCCLVTDPYHDRLLMGTYDGYRIYLIESEAWLVREEDIISNGTWSFATDPQDEMSLFVGKQSAFWSGHIDDHYGLTVEGPAVWGGMGLVSGMCRDPLESGRLFATAWPDGYGGVLRSTDNGESWEVVHYFHSGVYGYAAVCAPDGDLYIGYGPQGVSYGEHGIQKSADGGDSWVEVSGDMTLPAPISDIFIDPEDPSHIYAKQGGLWEPWDPALGIYETVDGGIHWIQVFSGDVRDLTMHPLDPAILACITSAGIWLTIDGGGSWENVTGDLPGIGSSDKCTISRGGRLFIADSPDHIWAAWIDPTAADETPAASKLTLFLYPNPFNPRTEIHFSLSEAGPVHVEVHDTQGRRVRLLATGSMEAGEQVLAWDGCDDRGTRLASGIYLLRVQARTQEAGAKLVLLK